MRRASGAMQPRPQQLPWKLCSSTPDPPPWDCTTALTKKCPDFPPYKRTLHLDSGWKPPCIATLLPSHYHSQTASFDKLISSRGWPELPSHCAQSCRQPSPCSIGGDRVVQKLCDEGRLTDALGFVGCMVHQIATEKHWGRTYIRLLKACAKRKALTEGRQVHALMVQSKCDSDIFLANNLIDMYSKCGSLPDARTVFDTMPHRNVFSWTTIVSAYAKHGCLDDARALFDRTSERNVVTWNAMIAGYAQHGLSEEALALYEQMKQEGVQANNVTLACALKACAATAALEQGKRIHSLILEEGYHSDMILQSALVDLYAKCGCVEVARELFNGMRTRDEVSWNAMIAGYAQNGLGNESLALYEQMKQEGIRPDKITYVSVLNACANIGAVEQGKQIHSLILEKGFDLDAVVQRALVDMYAKCACLDDARQLFDNMSERNVVSWTAMIAGYVQNGLGKEALALYEQMKREGIQANKATCIFVLKACANIGALEQGKEIHCLILEKGFGVDVVVENTLIDMYAKCGCLEDARELFDNMMEQNVVSANAMMAGYAQNGLGEEALALYEQMKQEGIWPDDVTYTCLISACDHSGMVEEGFRVFDFMCKYSCVTPCLKHYNSMIDLLGRAGMLAEAEDFIMKMPIEPDSAVWMSLLGAARNAGRVGIAQHAFTYIVDLEPENAAPYLLLIDIYAALGQMDTAAEVRKLMDRSLRKML